MSGAYRPLRRPIGGWGARQWRRDVSAWIFAAFLTLTAWLCLNLIVAILDLVAEVVR